MPKSPTSRTLDWLRRNGFDCFDKAEHWQSFGRGGAGIRKDLFGWCDLIVLDKTIIGIQVTSASNMSARCKKMQGLPGCARWIAAGGEAWVMGWRKSGRLWVPRILVGSEHEGSVTFKEQACDKSSSREGIVKT